MWFHEFFHEKKIKVSNFSFTVFTQERHRSPRPQAWKRPLRVRRSIVPRQNLWFRSWLRDKIQFAIIISYLNSGPFDTRGLSRIHGPRGRRGLHGRFRAGPGLRQEVWPLVPGHHHVHLAVWVPALLGQLRRPLRVEPGGALQCMPRATFSLHPGWSLWLPGGGVEGHLRWGQRPHLQAPR